MMSFKKWIAVMVFILSVSMCFAACDSKKKQVQRRKPTIALASDAILYEDPDGKSNKVGSIAASDAVEYISKQEVEGVTWYETTDGWFSFFAPDDQKNIVVSSGFAKTNITLLSGASASAAEVGNIEIGSLVEIYQVRDLWGRTAQGWVTMEQIYIPGRAGTNPGWCLTLAAVECYSEPAYDSSVVTQYRAYYRLKFYETLEIDSVPWGYTDSGWVDLSNVYIEGTVGQGACRGTVIDTNAINVRSGPGTGYELVRSIPIRSSVEVLFQVTVNSTVFGFVGDGWVYMDYLKIEE